jgi:hypothetical protein
MVFILKNNGNARKNKKNTEGAKIIVNKVN